jgi:ATP-dependent DNA helicase RecQ
MIDQTPPNGISAERFGELLRERFGLHSFRPGQLEVLEALESDRAALAVFPTGGGKSLCYQLPALVHEGVTVVISPLIALMKDQIDFLHSRGIAAARLDSSLGLDELREVNQRLRDGSLRLLYVAPERFNNERFLEQMRRTRIALFAIDEAHCISEWGHNFRPDYLKLAEVARELAVERVLALTATATPPVVADIQSAFGIPTRATVVTGFHRPNLFLSTAPTPPDRREGVLVDRLRSRPPGSTIVYVTLQRTAERVAEVLASAGFAARPYHAGLAAEERTEVQEWWKGSDRAVVVATIAFGMGIDKTDVRYVYHFNLPKGLESYSQEIGRAGRDGLPSTVEVLGDAADLATLENFVFGDTPTEESLHALVHDLLDRGEQFDVSTYALSRDHDIRPLVLRTALTYLELLNILHQGTPFYAGFKVRPLVELERLISRFPGEKGEFVAAIFAAARQGRSWYSLDAGAVAESLGEPRDRVIAALNFLGESGLAEIQVSDARQRFTRTPGSDPAALADQLVIRFGQRERAEVQRIGSIVELITHQGCQTAFLLEHFGERLPHPCGHCTFCEQGRATSLPPLPPSPPPDQLIDPDELRGSARPTRDRSVTPGRPHVSSAGSRARPPRGSGWPATASSARFRRTASPRCSGGSNSSSPLPNRCSMGMIRARLDDVRTLLQGRTIDGVESVLQSPHPKELHT